MKLKILFIPAWYPSEGDPLSGIFIKEHAKAASLYNEIRVMFVQARPKKKNSMRYEMLEAMEDGIKTIRTHVYVPVGNHQVERVVRLVGFFRSFQRLIGDDWRPDLIHAHVYSAGLPALLIGRLYGIPILVSEHWSWFTSRRLTLGRRLVARWVLNRVDGVIAVSKHLREAIRSYGVRNTIHVIPNVVDTTIFFPADNGDRRKDVTKRILFVGRLSREKGLGFLLKAVAIVRQRRQDFMLDIVGDGEQREELYALADRLGVASVVRFRGLQKKTDVAAAMQACDLFVQPSLWETFGIAPMEALACGKPVIVSDIPGPRELIAPDMGLLVPPGDALSLAEAISVMLDKHEQYSAKILAAYVALHYGLSAVGQLLDKIYRSLYVKRRA